MELSVAETYEKKIADMKKEHEKQLIVTAACNVIATTRKFQTALVNTIGQYDTCEILSNTDKDFLSTETAGDEQVDNDLMLNYRYNENSLTTEKLMKKNMKKSMIEGFRSICQAPEIIVNGQTYKIGAIEPAKPN